MPQRISIDDTNTTLIAYQGDWTLLVGSSRQWNSTVHTSLTPKSSATFRFRGYQVWIWGTKPAGTASNSYDISIDGSLPNITSRTSNGSAVYEEPFYASPLLSETFHEIVVTNQGSRDNGNAEFMLDRFEFETNDEIPLFTTPGFSVITSSTTSSSSSSTASPTHLTNTPPSSGKKTPVGAIAGAVIGVLVLVIAALGFLLWKKSKRGRVVDVTPKRLPEEQTSAITGNGTIPRNPLLPVPYQLNSKSIVNESPNSGNDNGSSSMNQSTSSRGPQMSEKSGYTNHHQADGGVIASTSSLIGITPGPTASFTTSSINRDDHHSRAPSSPNDGSSNSMYYPYAQQRQEATSPSLSPLTEALSSVGETPEQPPPSYSRQDEASASSVSNSSHKR